MICFMFILTVVVYIFFGYIFCIYIFFNWILKVRLFKPYTLLLQFLQVLMISVILSINEVFAI